MWRAHACVSWRAVSPARETSKVNDTIQFTDRDECNHLPRQTVLCWGGGGGSLRGD